MKWILTLLVVCVAMPASAGWKADCRHAVRDFQRTCRQTHAASLTTTTTLLPYIVGPPLAQLGCGTPPQPIRCFELHSTEPGPDFGVCATPDLQSVCGLRLQPLP